MSKILVFIEHIDGEIKKQSTEAITAGKKISDSLGGELSTIALGKGAGKLQPEAGKYGATKLHVIEGDNVANYSPDVWAELIRKVIDDNAYTIVIASATSMGKDILPHVSAKYQRVTAQDAIKLDVDGGKMIITRPMFAGKILATTRYTDDPQFVTLRPNAVSAEEFGADASLESVSSDGTDTPKSIVTEIMKAAGKKIDVAEAEIIVSGGRGMGGPENWALIEELADLLGAANGASRAAVDADWRPHSEQVGQTGKTVSPQLYIAVGISGAIQHLAGMGSSKFIVAINKDPEAPIFKVADYGIVGDLFDVVPKMIEELKK